MAIKEVLNLKKENRSLKQEIKILKSKKSARKLASQHISGKTNPATASMFVTGRRGKLAYSREDICIAAILKSMSRRCYKFLKRKKLLKLPSEATVSQWLADFTLNCNGLQHSLLNIIKSKNISSQNPDLWLSFDEMYLREAWVYDAKQKVFLPPAKKLQVIMVRNLKEGWKLPIYFNTDVNMSIEILKEVILPLEELGFVVRGASFDLGNSSFLSECNFTDGNYYIPHPADHKRKFYIYADPPHLIKLIRNRVLSMGVYLPRRPYDTLHKKPTEETIDDLVAKGEWIYLSKKDFQDVLDADAGELKIAHTLKPIHVDVEHSKTSVRVACQLFSLKTAAAMEFISPEKAEKAEAIRTINNVSTNISYACKFRLLIYA